MSKKDVTPDRASRGSKGFEEAPQRFEFRTDGDIVVPYRPFPALYNLLVEFSNSISGSAHQWETLDAALKINHLLLSIDAAMLNASHITTAALDMSQVIANDTDAVIALDAEKRVRHISQSASEIIGSTQEKLVGTRIDVSYPMERFAKIETGSGETRVGITGRDDLGTLPGCVEFIAFPTPRVARQSRKRLSRVFDLGDKPLDLFEQYRLLTTKPSTAPLKEARKNANKKIREAMSSSSVLDAIIRDGLFEKADSPQLDVTATLHPRGYDLPPPSTSPRVTSKKRYSVINKEENKTVLLIPPALFPVCPDESFQDHARRTGFAIVFPKIETIDTSPQGFWLCDRTVADLLSVSGGGIIMVPTQFTRFFRSKVAPLRRRFVVAGYRAEPHTESLLRKLSACLSLEDELAGRIADGIALAPRAQPIDRFINMIGTRPVGNDECHKLAPIAYRALETLASFSRSERLKLLRVGVAGPTEDDAPELGVSYFDLFTRPEDVVRGLQQLSSKPNP
ncbi:MAG: PAS domain-containing protein [Pseudomonadota bacterium]